MRTVKPPAQHSASKGGPPRLLLLPSRCAPERCGENGEEKGPADRKASGAAPLAAKKEKAAKPRRRGGAKLSAGLPSSFSGRASLPCPALPCPAGRRLGFHQEEGSQGGGGSGDCVLGWETENSPVLLPGSFSPCQPAFSWRGEACRCARREPALQRSADAQRCGSKRNTWMVWQQPVPQGVRHRMTTC